MQVTFVSGYVGVIIFIHAGVQYINLEPERTHNRTSSTVILRILQQKENMAISKGKEVSTRYFCFHINSLTWGIPANLSPTAIGLMDL
jgi:hypothetical protein